MPQLHGGNKHMIKKTIAILSVFAVLFGLAACKGGNLEGNLEAKTTAPSESAGAPVEVTMADLTATNLFVDDGSGNTIPVETKVDSNGDVIYAYTNANGEEVTQKDTDNIVGVTKYSKEDQEGLIEDYFEELSKQYAENPDGMMEKAEDIDFVLADGLVPENQFTKTEIKLDANGNPDRADTKSYQQLISGNAFTLKMNIMSENDGIKSTVPMTWIKSGNNMIMETSMPVDASGNVMKTSILIKDSKCYMIIPSMRMYAEVPAETFEEMFNPEFLEEEIKDSNVYDSSYTVKANGKSYSCDKFVSKDGQTTTKNFFDDKGNLVRTEIVSGDDVTIWELTHISDKADASKIAIPSGFFDMSVLYGEDIPF